MKPTDSHDTPGSWHDDLTALLAQLDAAQTPEAEAQVVAGVAALEPALLHLLIEHLGEQESPDSATVLAALVAHAATPASARAQARAALESLAVHGVSLPSATGETFLTGWVQQGRERGEQIMLLAWRLTDSRVEAFVFLLDWRGDGLKDFYRTRAISDAEWQELVAHNGNKGAPLAEISLAEGRALLEAALAEGRRFSRPVPREYRLTQALIKQRVMDAVEPIATRPFISADLDPVAVVTAYVGALHYRDYLLAWELLAPDHALRAAATAGGAHTLRQAHKHAPRPRPEVSATLDATSSSDARATVLADGAEEQVEPSGRKVRQPVRERYTVRRAADGWRIMHSERVSGGFPR